MKTRRAWSGLFLLPCLLVVGGCQYSPAKADAEKAAAPAARPQGSTEGPGAPVRTTLAGFESVLTGIYERVSPSVVNISVTKTVAQRQSPFPDIPGFRFFGPDGPGGQGGQGGPGAQGDDQGDDDTPNAPRGRGRDVHGSGSGFVWDTDGHIVTNNHVVGGADKVTVTFSDGTLVPAKVVGTDPDSDLAVIKVDLPKDRLPVVQMADSAQVKVGQLSVAIGNPFGLEGTMTVGFISALGRLLPVQVEGGSPDQPGYTIPDVIQTDAPINPGNSGGVLVNSAGQVIGVTSAIISPAGASAGIGFAIPSDIVLKVVPALITKGGYQHTWLGISGVTLSPDMARAMRLDPGQRGALVEDVTNGSPAAKAGARGSDRQIDLEGMPFRVGGDVVTAINDQPVKRFDDIVAYLARSTEVGQTITLTVLRDGKPSKLNVTLAARPGEQPNGAQQPRNPRANQPSVWLGIRGSALAPPVAEAMRLPANTRGVLVAMVENGSPADQAGLRGSSEVAMIGGQRVRIGGDVVVAAGGQSVETIDQLQGALNNLKPGDKLDLKLIRGGQPTTVTVTLAARPGR